MNLVNLFGNKSKSSETEYFLAIEIHESLIKTALWEVKNDTPSFVQVGSFESWDDEDSLINGVDASLEQAVKAIQQEPRRVIFGLPDSWIVSGNKIHTTKTKLISRLVKELGLQPIGMVPINSAIAHYMKKIEGIPPTAILLEIYTTKVVVSIIEKGEITATEETARSDDLAQDVEEGLTVIGKEKLPSRFILTNGGSLEEEEQRITSHPWQGRNLPFQHMPKVEVLPVDFSIKAVALTGGSVAIEHLSEETPDKEEHEISIREETNIIIPHESPASISELGFSYEETVPPEYLERAAPEQENNQEPEVMQNEPEYAISQEEPQINPQKRKKFAFPIPKISKIKLPDFKGKKISLIYFLSLPIILLIGSIIYFLTAEATVMIYFNPQKITDQFQIDISENPISGIQTLGATKKTVSGPAEEQINTTGDATVGDKAIGSITIANKSIAPIVLKAGDSIVSENGKYTYLINDSVTVASKSADPLTFQETYGKAVDVKVTASKIGADYNLPKSSTFSVGSFSRNVAYAVADVDFSGGTSRAVRAVAKADQDKLLEIASNKIKQQIESSTNLQNPGYSSLVISTFTYTKKVFDKNVGEEATVLNLSLEGSIDTLVYSEEALYKFIAEKLAPKIPAGSEIFQGNTSIKLDTPSKKDAYYQVNATVEAGIFPKIDEAKYKSFIKGKPLTSIRPFFTSIQGFNHIVVRISPKIPILTTFLPYNNIKFELIPN